MTKKTRFILFLWMVLCAARMSAQTYVDRGIKNGVFVPKGAWMGGCTFSYNEHVSDNIKFLILDNINSEGYTFKVNPYVGYFLRDDLAVGLRVGYSRTLIDLGTLDVNLGDDLSFKLRDNNYQAHQLTTSAFLRSYMSIGGSKVFGFFNDLRLTYSYQQAKFAQPDDNGSDIARGTFQTKNGLQLGAAPGLTAFVTNFAAVEVSVDVVGLNYNWVRQTTNQVETSKMHSSGANFKINLLSVNIGMCIYL